MARSFSIFIVSWAYPDPDLLLGAFTVKHELATWLGRQPDPSCFLVMRAYDGNLRYKGTNWERGMERVPISEFTKLPEYERAYNTIHSVPLKKGLYVLST